MPSQQLIDIIIKAKDEASGTAKKVDNAFRKMGRDGANSARQFDRSLLQANNSLSVVGGSAVNASNLLHQMQLDPNFASTMDRAKLKTSQMGYSLDSAKGKIMTFANAGRMTFDNVKNKVSATATSIKQKFGTAIDNCKAKLKQLEMGARQTGAGMGLLEMTIGNLAGMIGFELVAQMGESAKGALNASASLDYFAGRLSHATGQTNLSAREFKTFKTELKGLQQEFKKVNMNQVGATAEELAVKYQLPVNKLSDLTRMTAVMSSEFVKQGRTQEDAVLAVGDALDGEFRKLKEIGISQDDLKRNGWSGDIKDQASLIDALNKTMEEMGYEQTAKDISSLDDAFQVLNVSLGNLMANILIPLTPLIVTVIDAFTGFLDVIQNNPYGQLVAILTGAFIAMILLAGGLVALTGAEGGMIAMMPPAIASLLGLASAGWSALIPFLPWIALGGIIAVAIFEIGKAFGWWTDIGSMLEAISAGLGKLWNAFINHPDVQAVIKAIGDAFNWLVSGISWAGRQVLKFFGITTGSKWDVVTAIINGIGSAWAGLKGAIGGVISFFSGIIGFFVWVGQTIYNALKPIVCILLGCSPGVLPALQLVYEAFSAVWGAIWAIISPIVSQIVMGIRRIISIFDQFKAGQISLPQLIFAVLSQLLSIYISIATTIGKLVLNFAKQMLQRAILAGKNFVTGIINWLKQLPSKALSVLLNVLHTIANAGQQWINTAKQKAKSIVDNVYNALSSLPSKITSALAGVVNSITKPFKDAYDGVVKQVDKIKKKAGELTGIDLPAGGEPLAYGGESAVNSRLLGIGVVGSADNSPIIIEDKISLSLDLQNVPSHIDTSTLIEALSNKNVLNALVTNRDFQTLDANVKQKINLKNRRSGA